MGMTIDEIIKKENEIAAEFQKVIDTHIVNDDGFTVEEMYCDDSEAIDDNLSRCKNLADYHKQIADVMTKYQKIRQIYEKFQKDGDYYHHMAWLDVVEVLEDGCELIL